MSGVVANLEVNDLCEIEIALRYRAIIYVHMMHLLGEIRAKDIIDKILDFILF